MWSRKRIDIGWRDLFFAARHSLGAGDRTAAQQEAERAWSAKGDTLACLSVRSGFDLLWTELNLPAGCEVLMSAVTIPDMALVVQEHGLIPVPVDLDPGTMRPDLNSLRQAITPKTKAIVVAHLFGTILDLTEIAAIANEHGLLLIEDGAQAFDGHRYPGHPESDVIMFSFGPIKTATALAGGLFIVRDAGLLAKMRATQSAWPVQRQSEFLSRMRTYMAMKMVSGRFPFGCLIFVCRLLGIDYNRFLNGAVRNFPADRLFASLRRQPCSGLLRLMARRVATFDMKRQDRRSDLGRLLETTIRRTMQQIDQSTEPGELLIPSAAGTRHTWWVFPVCVSDAAPFIEALRAGGFDSTSGGQLQAIPAPADLQNQSPVQAAEVIRQLMFLPFYPELTDPEVIRMAQIVARVAINQTAGGTRLSPSGSAVGIQG